MNKLTEFFRYWYRRQVHGVAYANACRALNKLPQEDRTRLLQRIRELNKEQGL